MSKDKQLVTWLVGASAAWFLLELAYDGNTISNQQFISAVDPKGSQVHTVDKWGRKTIQMLGFALLPEPNGRDLEEASCDETFKALGRSKQPSRQPAASPA